MATMVLSAAGSSVGGAAGGSLLGIGTATFGKALGAVAGAVIDQQILGRGSQVVEQGRVERLRLQTAGEGAPIPRLYGRMRVGGQLIWSSRFLEHVDESRSGGKATGPKAKTYSYSVSFAVALCAGKIRRIGRVWADGNEISLSDYQVRIHKGGDDQPVDPLIDAVEGGAPAFRGVAYLVFEDLPLASFGNRIPQLNVEVYREPDAASGGDDAPALSALVKGVAMSPGSGEFSLETRKVRRLIGPGQTAYENVNTLAERPDFLLALDQLEAEGPEVKAVSLIVSWFGDDLRCGECQIRPCVENHDKETDPISWKVSGIGRGGAQTVSQDAEGRPIYGGTPSDASVVRAIRELTARGYKVMFYPFILMDVPEGNVKPDPWTGTQGQPAFPWRGRITLNRAPGVGGSADKTAAAETEVAAFFGGAKAGDFTAAEDAVEYDGPAEWSFRRFILHYAHLCALAGGVDSFCIGSEMRSLTQIRSGDVEYPAVAKLKALAGAARGILGPDVKIGYAADWSEYFGHHPADGSNDVFFHLDPLWADEDIDFVGIDNYLPLSDWRYAEQHADAAARSVYSLSYLKGNLEGGEGYDWYYAGAQARLTQNRTPIADTAHGEDWIFRPKDLRNWWQSAHHNRPGGIRQANPTAWMPQSKPIWFTEIGCPAVDLGANQPNVFVDPKSSENALPYFARGVRDDFMQRRYLQAALSYWGEGANNPVSPIYGARMIDAGRVFVWTWDARPWPDYPNRLTVWSDGANHRLGHWLTGRLGAASLADTVAEICRESGLSAFDVSELFGIVQGFMRDDGLTARSALQSLMMAYAFDAVESGGILKFRHRDRPLDGRFGPEDLTLAPSGGAMIERVRVSDGELPQAVRIGFIDSERDYETGATEGRVTGSTSTETANAQVPIVMDDAAAQEIADRFLAEAHAARDGLTISCGRRLLSVEPGDILALGSASDPSRYRVDAVEDSGTRTMTLSRIEPGSYAPVPRTVRLVEPAPIFPSVPVVSHMLDLPLLPGGAGGLRIAATAQPWTGAASLHVADAEDGFEEVLTLNRPAVIGYLAEDLAAAPPDIWTRGQVMAVRLVSGGLNARPDLSVLNGANRAALMTPSGAWEIVQFQHAEMVAGGLWHLSRMLRGQAGTEAYIGQPTPAGAAFVLLDDAVRVVETNDDDRRIERHWRIGLARKPIGHDSFRSFSAADRGIRLRPFAPAHLKWARDDATGDLTFRWIRRVRHGGDSWEDAVPPQMEDRIAFAVRIADLRMTEVGEERWVYPRADQIADGIMGNVEVGVAQISDQFGPGPEAKVTINV